LLGKQGPENPVENSALATGLGAGQGTGKKPGDKDHVWCDYRNKPHHTCETCWKILGKPENWKGSHEDKFKKNPAAQEASSAPFNKEQIDQLLKLFKSSSGSSSASNAFVAQASSDFKALSCHSFNHSAPWIIDSGASDHMTSLSSLYHSYYPCSGHEKICIADGSYSPIAGKGVVNLYKMLPYRTSYMVLNQPIIYYQSINYPEILIVVSFSLIPIVSFRN
jgi:hypothetical protein